MYKWHVSSFHKYILLNFQQQIVLCIYGLTNPSVKFEVMLLDNKFKIERQCHLYLLTHKLFFCFRLLKR